MYDIRTREITEAIQAADVALEHLERARKSLSSASGWGLFDTLGGGFLSGLIKHGKMNDAEYEIKQAKKALEKGIDTVVFDRGGFIYAGKIQALADAAREAGLNF